MIKVKIDEDSCMGDTGKGQIKLQKAWQGKKGESLYECWVEMKVKYGSMARRKGHGNGESYGAAMWAIAKAGEQEESDLA